MHILRRFNLGLHRLLLDNIGYFDARLEPFGKRIKRIERYQRFVNDVGLFPLIQIGSPTLTKKWIATDGLIEYGVEMMIYGYTAHDDTEANADLILTLGDAISDFFEIREFFLLEFEGVVQRVHYGAEEPPISNMRVETVATERGSEVIYLREVSALWRGYIDETIAFPQGAKPIL